MKYVVITPVKNERDFIRFTLDSVISQSLQPEEWIIVDDGSTDNTVEIIRSYQQQIPWIKLVQLNTHAEKKLYGSKVIHAFNEGLKNVQKKYDFIVKLDADLTLPSNYFEEVARCFSEYPKVGICGGYTVEKQGDFEAKQKMSDYVQGPIKSVRKECFAAIGGFIEENGWDGFDQLHAMYLGWEVRHIPLAVIHHRIPTTEYRSLSLFFNNGKTHYRLGNNFFLTLVRTLFRIFEKPYILGSLSYFSGWMTSYINRAERLVDKDLAKFIRKYHYRRILSSKR